MFGIIKWFFSYDMFISKFISKKKKIEILQKQLIFAIFRLSIHGWKIIIAVGKLLIISNFRSFLVLSNFVQKFPT